MTTDDKGVAFCGLDCAACQCYQATLAGDPESLERARQFIASTFKAPNVTIRDVTCEGCRAPEERRGTYCAMCEFRACATERGVATCGHCADNCCATLAPSLPTARRRAPTRRPSARGCERSGGAAMVGGDEVCDDVSIIRGLTTVISPYGYRLKPALQNDILIILPIDVNSVPIPVSPPVPRPTPAL